MTCMKPNETRELNGEQKYEKTWKKMIAISESCSGTN